MPEPYVAVVIPTLDAADVLPAQLDAMTRQDIDEPWELLIADNGSGDDTVAVAESYADRLPIRIVHAPERGINRARNTGFRASTADRVLFTDADDIVGPGWVRAMAEAIEPGTVVGGWLDRRHLPPDPERTLGDGPVSAVFRGEWLPYPIGCCMGWDRAVLEDLGGFDEGVAYGGDEMGTIWRAQLRGASVVQAGDEAWLIRRERADPRALRRQAGQFGRAEARLGWEFRAHGHPNRLRFRSPWRATKAAARILVTRDEDRLENVRKLAYHGNAAVQNLRYLLRLDPLPSPAPG